MNNFEFWINEIADMPSNDSGKWVDLETGLAYDASFNYQTNQARAPRQAVSKKAADARAVAKAFGGKALTGTAKQKEWAEKIRAEVLGGVTLDQAELLASPTGLCGASKFWIENRNHSAKDFGEFIEAQKGLLKQARALKAAGRADEYATVAATYNDLTDKWGF